MSPGSTYVTTTNLGELVLASGPTGAVVDDAAGLLGEIERRCGQEIASLFGYPSIKSGDSGRVAAWYAVPDGLPRPLDEIDEVGRRPFAALLRTRLAALVPHLADPQFGPRLAAALNLRSARDVYVVGNQPVLVNWGMLPKAVAASEVGRETHQRATLGAFGLELPSLPMEPHEGVAFLDALARSTTFRQLGGASPPPAGGAGPGAPPAPAAARPGPAPAPEEAATGRPWLAPLVASVIAGVVLAALLIPGVLRAPDSTAAAQAALDDERHVLEDMNATLAQQLADLRRRGAGLVCRARPNGPPGSAQPMPADLLPPSGETTPVPAPAPGGPTNAAALADAAVVLVRSRFARTGGTGTAFFLSDRLLVTNSHVVMGEDGEIAAQVTVENKALGRRVPATVVARTDHRPAASVDLALLEVPAGTSRAFLKIANDPEKTAAVRAVGYPGVLVQQDAGPVPESSIGDGTVSTFLERRGGVGRYIVHTAAIFPGNSGGPLVDLCSRVVGVNTALLSAARGDRDVPGGWSFAQLGSTLRAYLIAQNRDGAVDATACTPQGLAFAGGGAPPTPAPGASPPGGGPPGSDTGRSLSPVPGGGTPGRGGAMMPGTRERP